MDNKEKLNRAFDEVDSKYIEKTKHPPKKRRTAISIVASAVLVSLLAVAIIPIFKDAQPPETTTEPTTEPMPTQYNPNYTPPEYPDALFSVDDIMNSYMIPETYSGTKAYMEIRFPEYLYLAPVVDGETIDVFEIDYGIGELDLDEYLQFQKKYIEIVEGYFKKDLTVGKYVYDEDLKRYDWENDIRYNGTKYIFSIIQYCNLNLVSIFQRDNGILQIGDKTIDVSMSDAAVCSIMQEYALEIMEFFDFQFTEIEITRSDGICIRCYNKDSDFVSSGIKHNLWSNNMLAFKIYKNQVIIQYTHFRVDPDEYIKKTESVRKLTLEEAHELLINGYCFGAHTCPKCMENHALVDFTEYDYVGMEYLAGTDPLETGETKPVVPFYVFYKKLEGEFYDGQQVYAKTWVPAIEISRLKEYFDNRLHRPGG